MDELEELERGNLTVPVTASVPALSDTLTNNQILIMIWMLICVVPNCLLIYIFVKKHLYSTNFYFTIMNWCISNIIFILCLFYFTIVPEKYISYNIIYKLHYINIILPTLTMMLVTLFMFKTFLYSEKFCTYFIYAYWCVFAFCTIAEIICSELGYIFVIELFYIVAPFKILSVCTLAIKILLHVTTPFDDDDDSVMLRIILSGVYILSNFSLWLLQVLIITRIFIETFFIFILYASYADGFVNIVLLIYFDPSVKCYFYALFRHRGKASNNPHIDDSISKSSV